MVEPQHRVRVRRSVVLVAFDFVATWAAAAASPAVRHAFDPPGAAGVAAAAARPMLDPLAAAALWCLAFAWVGLYRPIHRVNAGDVLVGVLRGAPAGIALVVVATFFAVRDAIFLPARSLPLIQLALAIPLVVAGRLMGLGLLAALARAGWGRSRVVVVGTGADAAATASLLSREGLLGSELLGHVSTDGDAAGAAAQPVIGRLVDLADLIGERQIDRVVVAETLKGPELRTISLLCDRLGVELERTAELAPAGRLDRLPADAGELPVVRVGRASPNRLALAAKRLVDALTALGLLLLLSPLLAFVAVALRLEGGGPALLRQTRIGRGGRPFGMFKFRSMRTGGDRAPEAWDGHLWKDPDDPRVTRLGRLLRRFSIDELPQLFNVLLGQMSLVGPRPLLATDLGPDGHSPRYPAWSEVRSRMLPGITGLWQVRGRNELSFEDMMRLDIFYCEHWSLALDLAILLRTGPAVVRGRGAY